MHRSVPMTGFMWVDQRNPGGYTTRLTWPLAAITASIKTPPISWCWAPLIGRLPPTAFPRERDSAAGDRRRRAVDFTTRFFIVGPSSPALLLATGFSLDVLVGSQARGSRLRRRGLNPSAHRRVVQVEEVEHVAGGDLVGFVLRHPREEPFCERARVRPVALDMGKVRSEHDALHAHVVAQLHGHALHVLDAEGDVLADVLAWPQSKRLEVQEPFGPMPVPLVPVVRLLHPERHPAEARLGEEDPELGQAVEYTAKRELGHAQERQRHPVHDLPGPELLEHLGIGARVLERRLRGAWPQAVEADMDGQRHLHVDGGRPEAVVLRHRIRLPVREHAKVDALEPESGAVRELGDGVVHVRPGDDAEANEAVRGYGTILLAQPVVIVANPPACWETAPRPPGHRPPAPGGAAPEAPRPPYPPRSRRRAARSRWSGPLGDRETGRDTAADPRRGSRRRRRAA